MEDTLYTRQKTLKLNTNISVAVVGCGGIGFWAAKFLAMSGVKRLVLFDNDVLEHHNLNRLDLPTSFLGKNKAASIALYIKKIRPECDVEHYPFKFSELFVREINYILDCTDTIQAQKANQDIALKIGVPYKKLGYDGTHISINNRVAEWGDDTDGYTIVPSWVVPAVVIAAMGVSTLLKYDNKEMSCDISNLFIFKG